MTEYRVSSINRAQLSTLAGMLTLYRPPPFLFKPKYILSLTEQNHDDELHPVIYKTAPPVARVPIPQTPISVLDPRNSPFCRKHAHTLLALPDVYFARFLFSRHGVFPSQAWPSITPLLLYC